MPNKRNKMKDNLSAALRADVLVILIIPQKLVTKTI